MPRQIRMITQFGIHVRGQHFPVGINFDVGAGDLIQQRLKIDQIMASHQDPRTGLRSATYRGRFRLAEILDVAGVQ